MNAWTQVKWRSSIKSRTVSKFPSFVWITVVQETEEKVENNSSKLAEQNKEKKQLKHKVSGYKSQSKRQSIAGCRLLLRTLQIHVKDFENCRKANNNITQASTLDLKHSSDEYAVINP